jgi:hypothetical protein
MKERAAEQEQEQEQAQECLIHSLVVLKKDLLGKI